MLARERVFGLFGTPAAVGELVGQPHARWDTARNNDLSELIGWYSLEHWYAWQVTVLGLGPVWTSANTDAQRLVGQLLNDGGMFGFGLSERTRGADIYNTDMVLSPDGAGGWTATGGKYYIGNGNCAARLSVFGRVSDDSPEHAGDYVFFLVDPQSASYQLARNVIRGQMYVAEFRLDGYPVQREDLLHSRRRRPSRRVSRRPGPTRPGRRRLLVRARCGQRPVEDPVRGLAARVRALRAPAQRPRLPRADRSVRPAHDRARTGRRAGEGPRLPAQPRPDLHLDRLRAAGGRSCGAGPRRCGRRHPHRHHRRVVRPDRAARRPDVRGVRPGRRYLRGRAARTGVRHRRTADGGADTDRRPGAGRGERGGSARRGRRLREAVGALSDGRRLVCHSPCRGGADAGRARRRRRQSCTCPGGR